MAIYDIAGAMRSFDPVGSLQQGMTYGNALRDLAAKRAEEQRQIEIRNGLAQFYRQAQPERREQVPQGMSLLDMASMGAAGPGQLANSPMPSALSPLGRLPNDGYGRVQSAGMIPTTSERVIPAQAGGYDYQGASDYLASRGEYEQAGALAKLRKFMSPDGMEFGLNPQRGVNPATGELEFFVTNSAGMPKFLGVRDQPKLDVKGGWIIGADGQPERPLPMTPAERARLNAEQERLRLAREADARAEKAAARADQAASSPKAVTEGERSAAGFLSRMEAAEARLDGKTPFKTAGDKLATSYAPGSDSIIKNGIMSKDGQLYQNDAMNWIRAKLRKESGAVIGAEEAEQEYRTYFPMPGDSDEKIKQKAQARKEAIEALRISAGGAYKPNAAAAGSRANNPPPTNSKGWRLMIDGNGNRAYVGPNNEIEEVK